MVLGEIITHTAMRFSDTFEYVHGRGLLIDSNGGLIPLSTNDRASLGTGCVENGVDDVQAAPSSLSLTPTSPN